MINAESLDELPSLPQSNDSQRQRQERMRQLANVFIEMFVLSRSSDSEEPMETAEAA
jgi:hypothetical protein